MREYLNEVARIRYKGNLTRKEEQELIKAAHAGDLQARNTLVERNLPFAIQYARKFINTKVDFEDLVSAAHLGLINAVEKYNPTSSVKFITYAVFQLKASIIEELKRNQAVYVPTGHDAPRVSSLDKPLAGAEDLCGVDLIESYYSDTDELAIKSDLYGRLHAYLEKCDERTKEILDGYFQLWNPDADLNDVGRKYDLTREGMRRVKNIVLNKLKAEVVA
jgi:RNA polymerase primary sigma factor